MSDEELDDLIADLFEMISAKGGGPAALVKRNEDGTVTVDMVFTVEGREKT